MSLVAKILQAGCRQVLRPKRDGLSGVGFVSLLRSGKAQESSAPGAQDKGEKETVAADAEEAGGLLKPPQLPRHPRAKSLKEMPGPKFFSNLREFFWKDGFGRIHEIQVRFRAREGFGACLGASPLCCADSCTSQKPAASCGRKEKKPLPHRRPGENAWLPGASEKGKGLSFAELLTWKAQLGDFQRRDHLLHQDCAFPGLPSAQF